MRRYVVAFGLLGFTGSLLVAMAGDSPVTMAVGYAVLWGLGFSLLGIGIGRASTALVEEIDLESERSALADREVGGEAEIARRYVKSFRRIREGQLGTTEDDEQETVAVDETETETEPETELTTVMEAKPS